MSIITIILFFLYSWGLGFTATKFTKNSEDFWERNVIRIGIGLAVFPIIAVLLNMAHIPLDWKIFLALSIVYPVYTVFDKVKKKEFKISKDSFNLNKNLLFFIALFIFCASLFMYTSGAFKYSYLEDDDSWGYAEAATYVSIEKNLNDATNTFKFLDPYPPAYVSLMGILHQTSTSVSWTLKFFNALIISLGILFFYFSAKKFTKNDETALFSTFVLAILPCFFTHFIWAISLAIPMLFIIVYCLEKIDDDSRWLYPSIAVIAGSMLTHPSEIAKVMILIAVYFIIKCLVKKEFLKNTFYSIIGGLVVSGLWWFTRWRDLFLTRPKVGLTNETTLNIFSIPKVQEYLAQVFASTSGTGTKAYTFNDFFVAKGQGLINVQSSFGIMASILLILGVVYIVMNFKKISSSLKNKEDYWIPIVIAWFILTFLNVNSATYNLPGFYSFRTWLLLAVPVALFSSLGLNLLYSIGKKADIPKIIILFIVVIGLLATSGYQKYSLNTSIWPPGQGWESMDEVQAHLWLKTLPDNTKVFSYGSTPVTGFDKYSCEWCEDEISLRGNLLDKNPSELYSFLKAKDYEYLLVSGKAYLKYGQKYGEENASTLINQFLSDIPANLYSVASETPGAVILKIL